MLEARGVEQVDEILGGEIPGGSGGIGTAARAAGRAVEAADPAVETGDDVGERGAARVVEVVRDLVELDSRSRGRVGDGADLARNADASSTPSSRSRVATPTAWCGSTAPVYGQPKATDT